MILFIEVNLFSYYIYKCYVYPFNVFGGENYEKKTGNKKLYRDWLDNWLLYKKHYIKESTYANYSNLICNHIKPNLGNYYLTDLNNKIIQNFLLQQYNEGRLDNRGKLSYKTTKDIIAIVKSSLKFAISEGLINNFNLEFIYPKSTHKNKLYTLSKQDQQDLVDYVLHHKTVKSLCVLLTLYSGIRIGELCSIQWKDIDFENNILHINKTLQRIYVKNSKHNYSKIIITNPKTINAEREIPINRSFASELKKFRTKPNDYVLSCSDKCVEPSTFRKFYNRILKKARVEKINFHGLRHTFATNCIKLGVDYKTVSELLGHSTVNITLNLYVHPQMAQKKKCINLICKEFQEMNVK